MSSRVVAIAGNPNTGKTALFNVLTSSRARVGNYPGVTVERRSAKTTIEGVGVVEMVDIPGTYSLLSRTHEEQIAVDSLLGLHRMARPDAVVICVSATALLRGLYLVLQAREMGVPVIVALTMVDEAGDQVPDAAALGKLIGCPVVPVVSPQRKGFDALRGAISDVMQAEAPAPRWVWQPSHELRADIARVRAAFPDTWPGCDALGLWALQSVTEDDELVGIPDSVRTAVAAAEADGVAVDDEVVHARYAWLQEKIPPLGGGPAPRSKTDMVDRVLIHRVGGFAVFLALMFVVFQSLFAWSDPAITLVEDVFGYLGDGVRGLLPAGIFADFVVDGVINGVGSVIVFLPQILLLFLFIGIMEDSGYMARVAYLMDRIMRSMNLHGRAFVPMMSGFACAVPAVLATRTLERRRDRLLTMMVVPLMTCSARLPVYTLIIAALFPAENVFGIFPAQGLLLVAMYLFSVTVALIAAWVLSKTLAPLKAKRLPFVIELPPYRMPQWRDVVDMMWRRSSMFLKEAGTVILVCTIALWALLAFPRELESPSVDYDALIEVAATPDAAAELEQQRQGELLRESYGGRLGRFIEPAIEPLGFDWKIGVGLIGAFAAREVFVSTMGVVYSVGDDVDEESATLREKIRSETRRDGSRVYSPLVGLSLMVFFALACQCMSTIAVVKRETGGYRWPVFLFVYMTTLAWVASFLVFQIGSALGF